MGLPHFIEREFRAFLRCGVRAHGFLRMRCDECAFERLVPLSCKGRAVCASCETLTGRVTTHHRFMLKHLLRHIEFLDDAIATCDRHVERLTPPRAEALARLDTIPGVARRTAEVIAAELGCDMTRFPTAGDAASLAGLCPGNNESAGKRLSGRTRFANRTLHAALVESARGAVRKRDCYLAAQYCRLVKRRGDKKAIVAVAHSILGIAYHVLRDGQSYRELGGGYFDRLNTDRLTRYHTNQAAGRPWLHRDPRQARGLKPPFS